MSRSAQIALIAGILMIVMLLALAVYQLVARATRPAVDLADRIATQSAVLLPQPTPTIYPAGAAVVQAVRPLARLETVQYSIEKVIVAESNQGPLGFLFGDRLLLVAHGEVIAGVDMSKLTEEDVRVMSDGTVIVTLPPAELFIATLDNDRTFVYDRDVGFLTNGNFQLETAARQAAEDQIEAAALEDGILAQADRNAESYLRALILALGFEEVVFITATPVPVTATAVP